MITSDDLDKIEQFAFQGGQVDCGTVVSLCEELRTCRQLWHASRGPVMVERYEMPKPQGWRAT